MKSKEKETKFKSWNGNPLEIFEEWFDCKGINANEFKLGI